MLHINDGREFMSIMPMSLLGVIIFPSPSFRYKAPYRRLYSEMRGKEI
jgi:hypothetical protein